MRQEIGKWLMDVAKYVTTAVIIASFLGGMQQKWLMYIASFFIVGLCFYFGLKLFTSKNNKK